MKTIYITPLQRVIAFVLLLSQLLTSCNWNGTILSKKEQERTIQQEKTTSELPRDLSIEVAEEPSEAASLQKDEMIISSPSIVSTSSQLNNQQVAATTLTLQAKGGHEVTVNEHGSQAIVQEKVQPPFQRAPLTLPIRKAPQVNLQHLAQQEKKRQERLVQVVFPEHIRSSKWPIESPTNDPYQQGYVLIAEPGLMGGAQGIRIDINNLVQTIANGYRTVGMSHLIQESVWQSMFSELASVLGQLPIDFSLIKFFPSLSVLDPGNVKMSFEAIASKYTGRNVRFDNNSYGNAYLHIIGRVRDQIIQKQSRNIDPDKYPSNSYDVYLKASANLFAMFPLAMEVRKTMNASANSTVSFDLGTILNVVEVEVRFNSLFDDFEQKEREKEEQSQREKQEKEQKEKETKQESSKEKTAPKFELKDISEKEEEEEVDIIHLFGNFFVPTLTIKGKDINLKGATISSTGNLAVNPNSDTTTSSESKQEQTAPKFETKEEEKILVNPTGKGIRNDSGGDGHFGASRGVDSNGKKRLHEGLDFQSVDGQDVVSPIQGKAINSFFEDKKKKIKIPTIVITPINLNLGFNKLELLYVGPIEERWRNINRGDIVGQSINLQSLGYPSSVGQHVHLQMKLNGIAVDPTPYFPGLN